MYLQRRRGDERLSHKHVCGVWGLFDSLRQGVSQTTVDNLGVHTAVGCDDAAN